MNFYLKNLEFPKVLEILSSFAVLQRTKEEIEKISPSGDYHRAEQELSKTKEAFESLLKFGSPRLRAVGDIAPIMQRANQGGMLSFEELLTTAAFISVMRDLKRYSNDLSETDYLQNYFNILYTDPYLMQKIQSAIISNEEVADNASDNLFSIRRKVKSIEGKIRERLNYYITSSTLSKYLQENIITQRNGRFVIPIKAEYRSSVKGIVHDSSGSGATVFIEPDEIVSANNDIRELKGAEAEEIERIVRELSGEVAAISRQLVDGFGAVVSIDLVFAKAKYAVAIDGYPPILNEEGIVDLKKARHPLLKKGEVVPVDIRVGEQFKTLVITGPNTGGKTVSLKTLGLHSIMAGCGLYLPAEEGSRVCVFKNILSDIGDEQSIEQSLSTFSGHMKGIIEILKIADKHSLVLLDELGAGTDPAEGAALAVELLETLAKRGCRVAATTHYAEIKLYALEHDYVENASCEFDIKTLAPTYKLLIGVPGKSNAFAISKRLGLPDDIIEAAQSHVGSDDKRFETVITELHRKQDVLEREILNSKSLKEEVKRVRAEAEREVNKIRNASEIELKRAKAEAQKIVENATKQAEALLLEIQEIRKIKESGGLSNKGIAARSSIKSQLKKLDDTLNPVAENIEEDDDYILPRPLKVGDIVFIAAFKSKGEVTAVFKDTVEVLAGNMKTKVAIKGLRLLLEKKQKQKSVVKSSVKKINRDATSSVDVRGLSAEEALMEVDSFIDNCVLSHLETVTIIHGVGTGVLKTAIRAHLRRHKSVKSSRRGLYGEGEDGVTIVEIK